MAGCTPIQKVLQLLFVNRKTGRNTIQSHTDCGAMGLTKD
jgi:hypothetical protein